MTREGGRNDEGGSGKTEGCGPGHWCRWRRDTRGKRGYDGSWGAGMAEVASAGVTVAGAGVMAAAGVGVTEPGRV